MLRIPWREHTTNEEVLKRTANTKELMLTIRKRQPILLRHVINKEGFENLTFPNHIEGKRKVVIYLRSLNKWMAEQE